MQQKEECGGVWIVLWLVSVVYWLMILKFVNLQVLLCLQVDLLRNLYLVEWMELGWKELEML